LELRFGVYPVLIDYHNEKDKIATVIKRLSEMNIVSDEETVLFTSATRTTMEHASNSIEIHKIKEMCEFLSS
jgi:pyruvate kinase